MGLRDSRLRGGFGDPRLRGSIASYTNDTSINEGTDMGLPTNKYNIRGISFPFRFNAGKVVVSIDEQHIKDSMIQIIGTSKGEYLIKPEFGSDLSKRLFNPTNVNVLAKIDIQKAINRWEPRVKIISIIATSTEDPNIVNISIEFKLIGYNNTSTLNFSLRS